MFGRKPVLREGAHVFSTKKNGEFYDFIFGVVTGIDGRKVGINGIIVNPVGLKNKISQGKTGVRSTEILEHPTPDNVVLALVYRVEHENFTGVLDVSSDPVVKIHKKIHAIIDGWVRESLPELINNALSLSDGTEKEQAKRILKQRMDTLYDKDLKKYLYSICRSLKILN